MTDNGLSLTAELCGSSKSRLTVRLNGNLLYSDELNPASARARQRFIDAVHERCPAVGVEQLEAELLALVPEPKPAESVNKTQTPSEELDVSRIVRPELHFLPELSGLCVPVVMNVNGKPEPRWMHYLAWSDGRRECRELGSAIELPDGSKVWIYPQPGLPSLTSAPSWSAQSRKAWLEGATANPVKVFTEICERFARYLDFPPESAAGTTATLALWSIMTYCYPVWSAIPYLFVTGPLGSGKSTLFSVLAQLVFRPLVSSNMTAPALFRTLHDRGGTLLLDEAERLRGSTPDVQETMSILLAGYRRGGTATRLEAIGDAFRTIHFDVFGPKAIACIAGLPAALHSRCIPVCMFRAGPESPKPRRRVDADASWQSIRDSLHIMALDYGNCWRELSARTDMVPDELSGRNFELWHPVLSLASWLDRCGARGLLSLMRKHAVEVARSSCEESISSFDEILLSVLVESVHRGERPTAETILQRAREKDFVSFDKATPSSVARRLRLYGLSTSKYNGVRTYRVAIEDLKRIQSAYGFDLNLTQGQNADPADPYRPYYTKV